MKEKDSPASPLIEAGEPYLESLYQEVSGYVSYAAGEKAVHAKNKIYLTYGEIHYSGVEHIIKRLDIHAEDVFYDLGSGVGKVTLQFFLSTAVKKAIGIEAEPTRHEKASRLYQIVETQFPNRFLGDRTLRSIQGNFLACDWQDATIIYTCSTCFSDELLKELGDIFNTCPHLRYIISLKPIPSRFLLQEIIEVECSWEASECYIYRAPLDKTQY